MKTCDPSKNRQGFTLTELLVVIFIIAILATIGFMAMSRVKTSAAKVGSISKMRDIGAAVAIWTLDSPTREPFFLTNGTGDHPNETGNGVLTRPGNPGIALFNVDEPESGWITDPSAFFSPLVKSDVPSIADYKPKNAGGNTIWGTFAWYHPFVEVANRTGWQTKLHPADNPGTVAPSLSGRFLMTESYNQRAPKYDKQYFHALMIDGSVVYVGDSATKLSAWKKGQ